MKKSRAAKNASLLSSTSHRATRGARALTPVSNAVSASSQPRGVSEEVSVGAPHSEYCMHVHEQCDGRCGASLLRVSRRGAWFLTCVAFLVLCTLAYFSSLSTTQGGGYAFPSSNSKSNRIRFSWFAAIFNSRSDHGEELPSAASSKRELHVGAPPNQSTGAAKGTDSAAGLFSSSKRGRERRRVRAENDTTTTTFRGSSHRSVRYMVAHTNRNTYVDIDGSTVEANANSRSSDREGNGVRGFEWSVASEYSTTVRSKDERVTKSSNRDNRHSSSSSKSNDGVVRGNGAGSIASPTGGNIIVDGHRPFHDFSVPEEALRLSWDAKRLVCDANGSVALAARPQQQGGGGGGEGGDSNSLRGGGKHSNTGKRSNTDATVGVIDDNNELSPVVLGCDGGSLVGRAAHIISRLCVDNTVLAGNTRRSPVGGKEEDSNVIQEGVERHQFAFYAASSSSPRRPLGKDTSQGQEGSRKSFLHVRADDVVVYSWRHALADISQIISEKAGGTARTVRVRPEKIKISVKSEITATFRSTVYPAFGIPYDAPMLLVDHNVMSGRGEGEGFVVKSPASIIHVTYWHHKHFHTNLGHSLFRVLDMLRTATGLVRKGLIVNTCTTANQLWSGSCGAGSPIGDYSIDSPSSSFPEEVRERRDLDANEDDQQRIVEGQRARLAALIVPEVSGRTMGPFIEPLLHASSLFESGGVVVLASNIESEVYSAEHGGMVDVLKRESESLPTATTTFLYPSVRIKNEVIKRGQQALSPNASQSSISTPKSRAQENLKSPPYSRSYPSYDLFTVSGVKCYDNIITNARGSPRFAEGLFDDFMKEVIVRYNWDIVHRWRLAERCYLGEGDEPASREQKEEDPVAATHHHGSRNSRNNGQQPRRPQPIESTFRVVIINRRSTRRIENADRLREAILTGFFRSFPLTAQIKSSDGKRAAKGRRSQGTYESSEERLYEEASPVEKASYNGGSLPIEVKIVELEDYGSSRLAAQAATFYCADVVIAVHGAALAWAVAMRTNAGDLLTNHDEVNSASAHNERTAPPSPPKGSPPSTQPALRTVTHANEKGQRHTKPNLFLRSRRPTSSTLIEVLPYDWHLVSSVSSPPIYKTLFEAMGSVGVRYVPYALGELPKEEERGHSRKSGRVPSRHANGYEKFVFSNNFEIRDNGVTDISNLVIEAFRKHRHQDGL